MIGRIKELRVKIDGLAQLTQSLRPKQLFKIDVGSIPEGWDLQNFVEVFEKQGYAITDSYKKDSLLAPAIQEIPQQFKEVEKATDSLYLAKAWLGKCLQELGEQTPYQNDGKRKDVKDIEGTADKAIAVPGLTKPFNTEGSKYNSIDTWALNGRAMSDYDNFNHIEKVDWLRQEIKTIIDTTENFSEEHDYIELEQGFVYKYLCEARFWLGFELERIKKQDDTRKESSNN